MEIQGKIIELLEPKSGQSSRGSWKKQDFIIETEDAFPKKVCITNWNDKVDIASLKPGDQVTVSINIESREYNGNWYTDVKVWKLDVAGQGAGPSGAADALPGVGNQEAPPPSWEDDPGEPSDDLPF